MPTTFLQISNVFCRIGFSKSLKMFLQISNIFHRTGFSKSLNTFLQISNVFHRIGFSKLPNTFLQISKIFRRSASSIRYVLFSMEKIQSLISPYTCCGLRALRYGWSAVVPRSCLFVLHVHGLRARCYGIWAIQGQEPSKELTVRTLLILRIIVLGLALQ